MIFDQKHYEIFNCKPVIIYNPDGYGYGYRFNVQLHYTKDNGKTFYYNGYGTYFKTIFATFNFCNGFMTSREFNLFVPETLNTLPDEIKQEYYQNRI